MDKLRLLLLEKEDEKVVVSGNYLEQVWGGEGTLWCSLCSGLCPYGLPPLQVRGLELRLSQAQKMLRSQEELQEKVKEVRWSRQLCSHPSGSCSSSSGLLTLLPYSQVLLALPELPPELRALLQHVGLKPNSEKAPAPL